MVITYASQILRQSQHQYCTTRREMLAAVTMGTHFCSYLRGAQFTLCTDHRSLRWLQKFRNSDGMLARWYVLLGQFSVTFEYRPGSQHANADGLSRPCGQCLRPDLCWILTLVYLRSGGVLNQIEGDREVVIAYASPDSPTVATSVLYYTSQNVGCCYDVYSFSLYLRVLCSLCAPTTGPSGGFKSFAIVTVCWLAGICFSASSQSCSNTDLDLSTLMWMAFHVSAVSVYDRIVQ